MDECWQVSDWRDLNAGPVAIFRGADAMQRVWAFVEREGLGEHAWVQTAVDPTTFAATIAKVEGELSDARQEIGDIGEDLREARRSESNAHDDRGKAIRERDELLARAARVAS